MKKTLLLTIIGAIAVVGGVAAVAGFESWVINVTAHIENALRVHASDPFDYGTVFPQEEFDGFGFDVGTSDSFSNGTQRRVENIDYAVKQKPKPKPDFIERTGADEARRWCHINKPDPLPNDPNDVYYKNCYPSLCPYLSKKPVHEEPGDVGVSSFHNPETEWGLGRLHKKIRNNDPERNDSTDEWIIDLSVPCFKGECAQDWTHQGFEAPTGLNGQTFGCDIWIEVTRIY